MGNICCKEEYPYEEEGPARTNERSPLLKNVEGNNGVVQEKKNQNDQVAPISQQMNGVDRLDRKESTRSAQPDQQPNPTSKKVNASV